MPVNFSGKWELDETEGYEEYLASMGVPADKMQDFTSKKPVMTIEQNGDNFTVTNHQRNDTSTYCIGTPFDGVTLGIPNTNIASWDGDKFVLKTTSHDDKFSGKVHVTTRVLEGGKLIQTVGIVGGPVAKRIFKKI